MAFSQQNKPLSIFKILCEAFKLPIKNLTGILPILLISFLTSLVLTVFSRLWIFPLAADLIAKSKSMASLDPNSPEFAIALAAIIKDTKELLGIEALFLLTSIITSSLITIATIHALSATIIGNLSCRSVSTGWKGPIVTQVLVQLLGLGYGFICGAALGFLMYTARGSVILSVCGVILSLSALILYLYLFMVWSVGVVLSVAEDGWYGLNAISKAGKTMRGRRWQGLVLSLIQSAISGAIFASYRHVISHRPSSLIAQVGIALVYAVIAVLVSLYGWAVIMVFYCDCKRSNGGKGMEMYSSLPTESLDDEV